MLKKQTGKKIFILLMFLFLNLSIFYSNTPIVNALANTKLAITPATQNVNASQTFSIYVTCTPTRPIKGFELELSFNPTLLKAVSVTEGDFFDPYTTFFSAGDIDNTHGTITNVFGLIVGKGNITSPGNFIKVTFTAKTYTGTAKISFSSVGEWTGITDEYGYLPISVVNGNVVITGGSNPPPDGGGGGGGIIIPNQPGDGDFGTQNNPPIITENLSGPTSVMIGVEYNYSIKAYDKEGDNITIMLDRDNGSIIWSETALSNTTVVIPYKYRTVENLTLQAIAQDEHGANSSGSNILYIHVFSQNDTNNSINPNVTINYKFQNQTTIFNASKSQNKNINIIKYNWDFGDNNTNTGNPIDHKYKKPGIYNVILTMTDSNNNTYIKKILITINKSDIEAVKKGETSKGINTSNILLGFLLIIIVALPIIAYIFIFQKKTGTQIINYIKKTTTLIYTYTKKTIFIILGYLGKIKTYISNSIERLKKPTTNNKKIGVLNFFTERSIENINKKIDKINTNIQSDNKPSFITSTKPIHYYNYNLKNYNVLKNQSDNYEEIIENFFKDKPKNLKTSNKINKAYEKPLKTYKVNLDENKISEFNLKIDKVIKKPTKKTPAKKVLKSNYIKNVNINDIDYLVDEIIKSRYK